MTHHKPQIIVTDLLEMRWPCAETSWEEVNKMGLYEFLVSHIDSGYTKGVGLAANQVGVRLRFAVYDPKRIDPKRNEFPICLLNPVITQAIGILPFKSEGCLSMPHRHFSTWRYAKIYYNSVDRDGLVTEKFVEGFEAVVVQHEIDHLNGILAMDRTNKPTELGPNERCACGSGKKYKKCHGAAGTS